MPASPVLPAIDIPDPLPLQVALDIVARVAGTHRLDSETVGLDEAAGRVLAEPCRAPIEQPPFDNAAMDGIAMRGADLDEVPVRLRVLDTLLAGPARAVTLTAGTCVRITTGAPMPDGADTVVVREVLEHDGDRVVVPAGQRPGSHVRKAGESLRRGDLVLAPGVRLGARHLGLLASLGLTRVGVRRQARISVFATGDELLQPGQPMAPGRIHDSNGPMLAAQARAAGCIVVRQGRLADDPERQMAALREAAADSDLIVTAGGVSMGEADYLPRVLASLGRIHFWRVHMKPGLPVLFGELAGCPLFGLPGNPVSSAVGFHVLVRQALEVMLAQVPPARRVARLYSAVRKRHARAEFVRGRLVSDREGTLWFEPHAQQGSAQLIGLAASDALALLDEDVRDPERGACCRIWPLEGGGCE